MSRDKGDSILCHLKTEGPKHCYAPTVSVLI